MLPYGASDRVGAAPNPAPPGRWIRFVMGNPIPFQKNRCQRLLTRPRRCQQRGRRGRASAAELTEPGPPPTASKSVRTADALCTHLAACWRRWIARGLLGHGTCRGRGALSRAPGTRPQVRFGAGVNMQAVAATTYEPAGS
eukprot:scaffold4564_cov369-Prasinococcus_capsulatus_cf.AAC.1